MAGVFMKHPALIVLLAAIIVQLTGCKSEHKYVRVTLPCGAASLEFTEQVRKTFETTYSNNVLYMVDGAMKRKICTLCASAVLDARPGVNERFYRLNETVPASSCAVIVNPGEFGVAEYEQIVKSLRDGLKTLRQDAPYWVSEIGSIRYLDENSLRRTYRTAVNDLTLQISPNGSVTLIQHAGTAREDCTLIGNLINNGKTLLLNTKPLTVCQENKVDLLSLVKGASDPKGVPVTKEFALAPVSDQEFDARVSEWEQEIGTKR
jgi:hypothetical protein